MMSRGGPPDDNEDGGGGYRRPPRTTRFTKGQSGNPAGRPRGRRREAPYEAVLGQKVTIREGGVERRGTAPRRSCCNSPKDGIIGRPSLWIVKRFWVLRFRLMVKRGPWLRPQASEGEAQHGPFC